MLNLNSLLTDKQVKALQDVGISSVYDFLIYLPVDLEIIIPFGASQESSYKTKFLLEAILVDFRLQKKNRPFFILSFQTSSNKIIEVYWFNVAKWVYSFLQKNQKYQVILASSGPFLSLDKISKKSTKVSVSEFFSLGAAELKEYLLPKYPKLGSLKTDFIRSIHAKIPNNSYLFNLTGLVPENEYLPKKIDLLKIHKPTSVVSFWQKKRQWAAFQLFLKMSLSKYLDYKSTNQVSFSSGLDKNFLIKISESLEYNLSNSQKIAIWNSLQAFHQAKTS